MDSPKKSRAFGVEKRLRQIQPSDARPRSVPSAGARTTRPGAWLGQEIPRLYYRIWRRTTGPGSFSDSSPRPVPRRRPPAYSLLSFPVSSAPRGRVKTMSSKSTLAELAM